MWLGEERHLGEVTKPSRGRSCLRTDLEALVEPQITSPVSRCVYLNFRWSSYLATIVKLSKFTQHNLSP